MKRLRNKLKKQSTKTTKSDLSPDKKTKKRPKPSIIILSIVALISLFVLVMPYLPRLWYLLTKPQINSEPYQKAADGQSSPEVDNQKGNRLVLPQIGVNAEILEGDNVNVIGRNQGVWRESASIDPSTPGNIVVAGHRFIYTAVNGGHFYNLTELQNGDKIYIKWQDQVYTYEVFNSKTVSPDQIEIRNNDPNVENKLTMYTCYPLGSTAERYVVEAKQI